MARMTTRALFIGVNAYPLTHTPLRGCVADAISIRRLLIDRRVVDPGDARFLLAPEAPIAGDPEAAGAPEASWVNIVAALSDLTTAARPGDHVIVYFAGHGVRITNRRTGERVYGFAPTDTMPLGGGAYGNLVLAPQLNAALRAARARGASVSVIADTCSSGGATRALATPRQLPEAVIDDEVWAAITAAQPAPRAVTRGGLDAPAGDEEWVVFSACRAEELANESPDPPMHGVFTAALLGVLSRADPATVREARWEDLIEPVKAEVAAAVRDKGWSAQTPTLEGQAWTAALAPAPVKREAGFAITVLRDGTIEVEGGTMAGLDVGAEIIIEPIEAVRGGDMKVRAVIERAEPARSIARLIDPGADVYPRSRARPARPSATGGRLGVRFTGVPAAVAGAVLDAEGASGVLAIDPPDGRVEIDVRPWPAPIPRWTERDRACAWAGLRGGWAIVPSSAGDDLTPDDVIAYLPPLDAPGVAGDASRLGRALGAALLHWASYARLLRRGNDDPALAGIVTLSLRAGATKEAALPRVPDASGVYLVDDGEPLWIAAAVRRSPEIRLFLGAALFSDDGNVGVLWPKDGADPALNDETLYIGNGRFAPLLPFVRPDQRQSRYTFKVIAYTGAAGGPPRLSGLAREETVQEVLETAFTRGGIRDNAPPPLPRWHTWDLPVVVRRPLR